MIFSLFLNSVFFILTINQIFSAIVVYNFNVCSPAYSECGISLLAIFIYLLSASLYLYFFSLNFIDKAYMRFVSKKNDPLFWFWLIVVIFYWIPVFFVRGVSGEDRVAYWMANSDIKLQSMLFTMYMLSFVAAISTNNWRKTMFIVLATMFIVYFFSCNSWLLCLDTG